MKKLMTALATAATALFAIGAANGDEAPLNATSFEELTLNTQLNTLADDTGDTEGDVKYWYMASTDEDNGTLVTNDVAGSGVTRPDYFANMNQTNEKALSLDTSSPLFRHMGTSDGTIPAAGEAIGDGIYLDTLVKFTAADDVFGDDALSNGVDKIAISYVEQGDDVANPITNFVIRAGYIAANEVTEKNYIATLPSGVEFDKNVWHRLTVRTIPNIDGDNHVGFAVYVDQMALVYADAEESIGDDVELVGVAATLPNAIYPSAVYTGDDKTTITAASFSGTGAIDDVVFTKVMPQFIAASSAVPVTITLGTGVTGVTVTVRQETINPVDATATPLVFNLPAGTTSFSLAGTLDTGYANFDAVFAEGSDATFTDGTVSFTGVSLDFTVKASRNNFNLFDADGQAISGMFETLSDALEPTGVAKIQLAYNYNVVANETVSDSTPVYVISKDIVLDLNGKTLDGGSSNTRFLFSTDTDCSLTVIDSVAGDDGKIIYGGTYGIFGGSGDIYIGSTELTDYGVVVDGSLCGAELGYVTEVVRGKFLASGNTTEGEFVYFQEPEDLLNLKSSAELVNDYWVVTYDGEEQPTTYTVTVTPTANATYAAVIGETDVTFTENVATVNAGSTVVITATAATGYTYTGVTLGEGWTPAQDGATATYTIQLIAAAAEVEIPAPTEIVIGTYTVTVTPNANATYTAAYKGGDAITPDNDVLTVTVGQTIVITATPGSNYEYAEAPTGWTAGQDGEITIEVSEAGTVAIPAPTEKQQSEYPSYIDENVAYKSAYDTWKTNNNVAAGDNKYEAAFLLNIAPGAEDQTLEPASITIADGKVVITANKNLGTVNGKVYVKTATTLAGLKTAEWVAATLDDDKAINVTPGSTDEAGFYQIKVDF